MIARVALLLILAGCGPCKVYTCAPGLIVKAAEGVRTEIHCSKGCYTVHIPVVAIYCTDPAKSYEVER